MTAVGAALALAAIIQAGAGSNLMYGVWAPETHAAVFGPFVNRNHFATWMLMAIPVAIAQCAAQLAALAHDAGPRATVVELLGAPRAGSGSRDGVRLLSHVGRAADDRIAVGVRRVRRDRDRRHLDLTCGAASRFGPPRRQPPSCSRSPAVAVGWIGWRPIAARINELPGTRLSGRLDAWSEAWRIARDFWPTGSGLNTYATTMLPYHDPNVRDFFRTPHNDYLQALCDGGVLVGLPLLATLGVLRGPRRTGGAQSRRTADRSTGGRDTARPSV